MLLKMLEFPGPDREWTRYMTIEPNEFKERPVLPDPFHIMPSSDQDAGIGKPLAIPRSSSTQPQAKYAIGQVLTGKVVQILRDGTVLIEIPDLPATKGYVRITASDLEGRKWALGNSARCVIMSISQDDKERTVLYCRPAPKSEGSRKK